MIFGTSESVRTSLSFGVNQYIKSHSSKIQLVRETGSADQALRLLEKEKGVFLLMICYGRSHEDARIQAVNLGRKILKKSLEHYMIYCVEGPEDLEDLLNTGVRPAGVLIPPYTPDRIGKALSRVERDYTERMEDEDGDCLVVTANNVSYRLPYSRILYLEAQEKKLCIWANRQCIRVRISMNQVEELLPKDQFVRCHRSYIVNMTVIRQVDFTNMLITLTSGDSIPVSRSLKNAVKSVLQSAAGRGIEVLTQEAGGSGNES